MSREQFHQLNRLAELFGVNASNCLIEFNSTSASDGSAGSDERAGHRILSKDFAYQQIVSNNITVAALTLWIWEWLVALPAEVHLYRTRRWSSPQAVLLFLVRYGTLPSVIVSGYLTFNNFRKDESCPQHTQLLTAIVQLIVSMTFGWRAIAIWRKDRRIVALVAFIVIAQFATSMTLLWFSDTVRLSNSTCMAVPSAEGFNSFPWFYLSAIIVDGLLMIISTLKLWQFAELDSPAAIRRREVSSHILRSGSSSIGNHSSRNSTFNSNQSRPEVPSTTNRMRSKSSTSFTPNISSFKLKCLSLTPLLRQLLKNGLFFFLAAAAFNIVNFALELSDNLHAKAVLQLYAPLMSVLASRVILLEVKALYGSRHGSGRSRERNLVDQVIRANEGRESWEGDDNEEMRGNAIIRSEKQDGEGQEKEIEVGISEGEGRASESPLSLSNPKSIPSSNSDPDFSHQSDSPSPHRIIQISPSSQVQRPQSPSYPLISTPPHLEQQNRRPSAISFEFFSNIKAVSKAFPHFQTSNRTASTPILPQVVEPEGKPSEDPNPSKEKDAWGLKNRFNSLKKIRGSSDSTTIPKLDNNEGQVVDTPNSPQLNSNSLQIPDLEITPSESGETSKITKGTKTPRHSHSRRTSLASNRSFDPSQISDANRSLALRMAGMDPNSSPKKELNLDTIERGDDEGDR